MNSDEFRAWLNDLADRADAFEKFAGQTFKAGPITVKVPSAGALRTWKHRNPERHPKRYKSVTVSNPVTDRVTDRVTPSTPPGPRPPHTPPTPKPPINSDHLATTQGTEAKHAGGDDGERVTLRGDVSCPRDLCLTEDQVQTALMQSLGAMPPRFIEVVTQEFVLSKRADLDARMPLKAWRKCLAMAVSSSWNNSRKRRAILDQSAEESPSGVRKAAPPWKDPDALAPGARAVPMPEDAKAALRSIGRLPRR